MSSVFAWFETLPLWGNTAIMAALSAPIALAYLPFRSGALRWALALLTPFAFAWAVYSLPVRQRTNPSDYSFWQVYFVILWGGVGASSVVMLARWALRRR